MIEASELAEKRSLAKRKPFLHGPCSKSSVILKLIRDQTVDLATASQMLERTGIEGMVLAGELALEAAMSAENTEAAGAQFTRATALFTQADRLSANGPNRLRVHTSRARVMRAFVPAHAYLFLEKKLPPANTPLVEAIYRTVVDEAQGLIDLHFSNDPTLDRGKIRGRAGEFAAMALFKRLEINDLNDQSYFAYFSTFSQDRRSAGYQSHAFDIGVLTHLDQPEPVLTYRTQIKCAADPKYHQRLYGPEISLVSFEPDLRLFPTEKYVVFRAAQEAYDELYSGSARASSKLDARTDLLMEALDREPAVAS